MVRPLFLALPITAMLVGCEGGGQPRAVAPGNAPAIAEVQLTQVLGGPWRLEIVLDAPARQIDLGPSLDGFRSRHWRAEDGGALLTVEGRDVLTFDTPRRDAVLSVEPISAPVDKQYRAFTAVGEAGVLVYSGQVSPASADGHRLDVRFDFEAASGFHVSVFGQNAPALTGWTSPFGSPAFVYFGPAAPVVTPYALAIVDQEAPAWIIDVFETLTPRLSATLTSSIGVLPATPNIFLALDDRDRPGALSFRGDALPAQISITLAGDAWSEQSESATDALMVGLAHEVAHLWQTQFSRAGAPAFIHEGGAEAVAGAALVLAGGWTQARLAEFLEQALTDCDTGLAARTLADAEAAGDWRTVYACGHVLTLAAAGSEGPMAFWRALNGAAEAVGGYDVDLFLKIAAARGGASRSAEIARFLKTKHARPRRALERLIALDVAPGR